MVFAVVLIMKGAFLFEFPYAHRISFANFKLCFVDLIHVQANFIAKAKLIDHIR